jgi:tRNA threonylcarbamoyladenosine biosynthesis protein TsaB
LKPVLAFETSSPELSIALFTGKGAVIEKTVKGFMSHAEKILPVTDKLLKSKKLSIDQIDTFLIGRGPGSFTGLRVGFATLKGLVTIKKKKCFGALSLDLIAHRIELPEGSFLSVVLDAHREKVYARLYKRSRGQWVAKSKPETATLEEWASALPPEVSATGDAVIRYRTQMETISEKKIHFLPEKSGKPKASTLLHLYKDNPKLLQALDSPKDFIPLYFRLSVAEERRNENRA